MKKLENFESFQSSDAPYGGSRGGFWIGNKCYFLENTLSEWSSSNIGVANKTKAEVGVYALRSGHPSVTLGIIKHVEMMKVISMEVFILESPAEIENFVLNFREQFLRKGGIEDRPWYARGDKRGRKYLPKN